MPVHTLLVLIAVLLFLLLLTSEVGRALVALILRALGWLVLMTAAVLTLMWSKGWFGT